LSENRIWGQAKNPYDHLRTTGGSSGGDAGLVSAKCVFFSIGSDIGGSLRYPAAFNGLATLKPTLYRTSFKGHKSQFFKRPAFNHIMLSQGPMCRTVEDVKLIFQLQLDPLINLYDDKIAPGFFRDDLY